MSVISRLSRECRLPCFWNFPVDWWRKLIKLETLRATSSLLSLRITRWYQHSRKCLSPELAAESSANIFNKIIRIHWKPVFHNATFGTTVCSVFAFSPTFLLPSHGTCVWCTPIFASPTQKHYSSLWTFLQKKSHISQKLSSFRKNFSANSLVEVAQLKAVCGPE